MKNSIQEGKVLNVTAPAAVTSGQPGLHGKLFGVYVSDAASGEVVPMAVEGVFSLAKDASVVAVGDVLYWSAANSNLTKTAIDNTAVAIATEAAATGDSVVSAKIVTTL